MTMLRIKMALTTFFVARQQTILGLAVWLGIFGVLGSLYFSATRIPLFLFSLATLAAIWLGALYWKAINESLHLVYFIGYLLLLDDTRAFQKRSFEDWLSKSDAKNAMDLSNAARVAIQELANRLAAGDPKKPTSSSVLGFHGLIWNRKLGRA
jgi:hypothetical protein